MDPRVNLSAMIHEVRFGNLPVPVYLGQNFRNGVSPTSGIPGANVGNDLPSNSDSIHEDDLHEDYDFSDEILRYISQILMEEDVEDKNCMLQESYELQVAEKSLYEAIGKKYPPSPDRSFEYSGQYSGLLNNSGFPEDFLGYSDSGDYDKSVLADAYQVHGSFGSVPVHQTPQSTYSSAISGSSVVDGLMESPESVLEVPDLSNENQSVSLFIKGVEEASKFIPSCDELIVSTLASGIPENIEGQICKQEVTEERRESGEMDNSFKGKKHLHGYSLYSDEEQRSRKQASVYSDPNVHSDMFDEILLHHAGDQNKAIVSLRETLQNEATKKTQQMGQSKGAGGGGGRGRGRRQSGRKEVIDFRTLLISCAQAVAVDDRRTANELLKKIRQHSSPSGDGNQRLAHCFADGLEARLAGTGSQIYRALISKKRSASDVLKAYLLFLAACPFKKISNFFSNKTIAKLARGAARIHIIDFGILYGFQWPTFIQCQSERNGGPPKIRITGIDHPQPGFRPAERVEETGRRLAHYAKEFRVPFEFNPIAKRWETIQLEDLKLDDEDELVIVNCIDRMKNLPDETMLVDSSRNTVLKLIRKINPAVFIHGVVNGAYNAPFFVTRFKEALFHFSSYFDMLETIVPREDEERMLLERDVLGREALNVVACEGWERVERPETNKQWQVRTLKAGFVQLPLDPEVKDRAKLRISAYHKDFVIDEDGHWLLLGWKGRIMHALSTWKPG